MKYTQAILTFLLFFAFQFSFAQETNVDQMPVWATCESFDDPIACTHQKMDHFIKENLKYPERSHKEKIEGVVKIKCFISKDGEILDPIVIESLNEECDEEAIRLVNALPNWRPAQEDGDSVNILYTFEIPFVYQKAEVVAMEKSADVKVNPFNGNLHRTMPYFSGCEPIDDLDDKRSCSNNKLIAFVSENLNYPETAKNEKTEGIVYVTFDIKKDGSIGNPSIKRDIGNGCGEEALRVLSLMPKWEPAKENGDPVTTSMTLPVRFSLSSGSLDKYQIHWGNLKNNKIMKSQLEKMAREKIIVRNQFGNHMTIAILDMIYKRKTKYKEENSTGNVTLGMMRIVNNAKSGGKILINARIQENGKFLDIQRVFEIIK